MGSTIVAAWTRGVRCCRRCYGVALSIAPNPVRSWPAVRWLSNNRETVGSAKAFSRRDLDFMRDRLTALQSNSAARGLGSTKREAAVLVPFCHVHNEAAVLFTVRGAGLRNHRSEVSFPGGMRDAIDVTLEDTALRETEEEIFVDKSRIEILGRYFAVPDKTGTIAVTPIVGMLGEVDLDQIHYNPGEVAAVFALTLRQLRDPTLRGSRALPSRPGLSSPTFDGGPLEVWGLTAFILENILRYVVPTQLNDLTPRAERDFARRPSSTPPHDPKSHP